MKCSECKSNDAQPLLGDLVSCVNCGATGPVDRGNPAPLDEPAVEIVVEPVADDATI